MRWPVCLLRSMACLPVALTQHYPHLQWWPVSSESCKKLMSQSIASSLSDDFNFQASSITTRTFCWPFQIDFFHFVLLSSAGEYNLSQPSHSSLVKIREAKTRYKISSVDPIDFLSDRNTTHRTFLDGIISLYSLRFHFTADLDKY